MLTLTLVVLAVLFAVVNGMNDGGALSSVGLKLAAWPPLAAVGVLAAGLVVVPWFGSTAVAETLTTQLVRFHGEQGRVALLVALVTTLLVVSTMAALRVPTSMTLASVGALAGAGLGTGLQVSLTTLGFVLGMGVAAPLLGALLAAVVATVIAVWPSRRRVRRRLLPLHYAGFTTMSLTYGLNDGQRMIAFLALAVETEPASLPLWWLVVVAACFAAGATVGLVRFAGPLTRGVMTTSPHHGVAAQLAASGAAGLSASVGAPVSMTQTVTGGLLGSSVLEGWTRIRWDEVSRMAGAWVATLPTALALGTVLGAGTRPL